MLSSREAEQGTISILLPILSVLSHVGGLGCKILKPTTPSRRAKKVSQVARTIRAATHYDPDKRKLQKPTDSHAWSVPRPQ